MSYTAESLIREIARMDPEAPDHEETLRTLIGEAREVQRARERKPLREAVQALRQAQAGLEEAAKGDSNDAEIQAGHDVSDAASSVIRAMTLYGDCLRHM